MAFMTVFTIASLNTVNKQGPTGHENLIMNLIINCIDKNVGANHVFFFFFNLSMNNIQIIGTGGEFTLWMECETLSNFQ